MGNTNSFLSSSSNTACSNGNLDDNVPPYSTLLVVDALIKEKNDELNFKELSLGMSNDYIDALNFKSTFIRIGTKIFGSRA